MLAKLCAPGRAADAGKAFQAMIPMLTGFPDGAFTVRSLEHVARAHRREPSYAELCTSLGEWWRENQPPSQAPMLEGPGGPTDRMDDMTRRHIQSWQNNREHALEHRAMASSLGRYRAKFPDAYRWIVANDLDAAAVAVRRGWKEPEEAHASWQDANAVADSVRLVQRMQPGMGTLLGKLVAMHAPEHLGLVPAEWHPEEAP